ncbi:MAG TPA: ASKHA domain-containing protein [Desulfatiglandales bacterium]|nr:ASKHA domain-containing protein [Desulfatiglandales bacterium]
MSQDGKAKVVFEPSGRRGEVATGLTVLEASQALGADIEAPCGGKRACGKCKVRIDEGILPESEIASSQSHVSEWQKGEEQHITPEEKSAGYRLSCCAKIEGDLLIFVPEESRTGQPVVCKAARDIHIQWNPAVKHYYVEVSEPTIEESGGDLERLLGVLGREYGLVNLDIDYLALRKLPDCLRQGNWKVTVGIWMDKEIIRILPGSIDHYYGVAVDLGTTTVAVYLCDMASMEVVNTVFMMNPQHKYGEDVMSRISYHMKHLDGLQRMNEDIVEGLNNLIVQACKTTAISKEVSKNAYSDKKGAAHKVGNKRNCAPSPSDIIDMTVVGNTIMHHIFLRLNPKYVGAAPFPPVIQKSMNIKARDMGMRIHESAYVHVLPNEAGYVGADNVGVLIAEEPYKGDEIQLIIDIGTNGELVLGNRDRLISSSCATGPAFEGAQIGFGMRAADGAIERLRIDPETHEVDYKVIGRDAWRSYSRTEEMQAKGICGSGVLDLLAELYCSGVILKSGRFNPRQKSNRYRKNPESNQAEFIIAWADETSIGKDIVITQHDIRQIQLAKGALYCGCKLMMRRMGIETVDKVKIAGAFGTNVDPRKALIMGLLPDCEIDRIVSVGNAAGDGARAALLNREKRKEAEWVSHNVEYVELTLENDFQQQFIEALQIPHMKDRFPHLKGIVPDDILNQ